MPFQIIRNDITKVKADAIVNTANRRPVIGGGTDSAIYKAAGEQLVLKERKAIGEIARGQAAHTGAYHLAAKYIIHTVGPAWIDGNHGERDILHSCYANSLRIAAELECTSIAFPLIATGIFGFPKDEALQIALAEINRFLLTHDMEVILVVFDRKAFELSGKLVGNIEEYIDEHSVKLARAREYDDDYGYERERRSRRGAYHDSSALLSGRWESEPEDGPIDEPEIVDGDAYEMAAGPSAILDGISGKSLDEVLENDEDTFQQRLFKLIDDSGMDDVAVYKKANIDRKVFSRIRGKEDYKPKKKTAVAFAIALQLDMPTMLDLLSRAEIAFSPSNKFDLIITYFITNRIYDIYEINAALFRYGQPILGV